MKLKIELELEIDDSSQRHMEDALFEPGYINYWGDARRGDDGRIHIIEHGGFDDPKDYVEHVLPADWLALGIKRMCEDREDGRTRVGTCANELMNGDYDMSSLDSAVQMALFGEYRYG